MRFSKDEKIVIGFGCLLAAAYFLNEIPAVQVVNQEIKINKVVYQKSSFFKKIMERLIP